MGGGGVFVNHRGVDSHGFAARLHLDLVRRFGADQVFLDVESNAADEDDVQNVLVRVRSARVLLAVIGPGWLALDDRGDRVRRELAAAFAGAVRVVPVLTDGADLPAAADVPADVAALSRCRAWHLRRGEFAADLDRLAAHLTAVAPELAVAGQAVAESGTGPREVFNQVEGDVPGLVVQAGSISGGLHLHLPGIGESVRGQVRKLPVDTGVFVGRDRELARLREVTGDADRVVVVAVHGLGGIGKSTLAARFAHLHAERFSLVWWVTADSAAAIATGLADLAVALDAASSGLPAEQRTERALGWLAAHTGWLLILDNLTTAADAGTLLERVRTGTILVTSRQRTGWRHATTVSLDVLSPAESVDLLGRVVLADWPDADMDGGDRLCAELGWLPLAIEQAGAYVAQNRVAPSRYLELLTAYPRRMFAAVAEGGDAQRTMARVWHVTLDRLADTPLAGQVLRELAWYAPDAVPRVFLERPGLGPEAGEALGRLAAYNMITLGAHTVSVHRLVQAVTRTPDPGSPHRRPEDVVQARDTTAGLLVQALAATDARKPSDWPRYRIVLPHARVLLDHTTPDADTDHHCVLAGNLGRFLEGQGNLGDAIALLGRAAASCERRRGPDDRNTLISRDNLARALHTVGDLGRAIPLFEATLADFERVLGPDHPDTLISRNELAGAYETAGDLARAIPLFEATLADRERVLGPDHPDTLISRNDLAGACESAGDRARAVRLYEATLADRERVLGADHPNTLDSRHNLAYTYQVMGDPRKAIPLYRATLADCARVLGADHPRTLTVRNSLAAAYLATGDLRRAVPLHETTFADRERVLGPDHPHTLNSKINLAHAYYAAGKPDQSIPLYRAALADCERVLGAGHPTTEAIRAITRELR